jgi:hypothetical protein
MTQDTDSTLVFVYGWQLDAALLAQYCPGARVLTTARLVDYDLGFYGHTPKWDGAEEAVVAHPGSEVWGLVLALTPADAERLDGMHNVHGDGSGSYFHYPADVEGADGQRHAVLLYMKTALGASRTPSVEYRNRIVAGALAHGLPVSYVARLRGIAAHVAGYPVPRGLRVIQVVAAGGDCHCSF